MVPASPQSVVLSQTTFSSQERKEWTEGRAGEVTLGWETGKLCPKSATYDQPEPGYQQPQM